MSVTAKAKSELMLFPPPRDLKHPFDPPPELMRRLREEPVSKMRLWNGLEAWVITRYEDGRAILADERFSADATRPNFPEKNIAYAQTISKDRNIRVIDNPEHDIQKRMMVADFTVKRVNEIRPYVEKLVDETIDEMLQQKPPVDLNRFLAMSIPTKVICELLGVPYEDRDFFWIRAKAVLAAKTGEEAVAAGTELTQYIEGLIDLKIKKPENDLISRLVHQQVLPGHLSREVLVSTSRLLLVAGHDTTVGMIGLSTLLVLTIPEAAKKLRENTESDYFRNAVEEMFRFLGTIHAGRRRIATTDVKVGGQLIRAGEGVIVMNNVMDRDESVFPNAGEVDFSRENVRAHNAFGFGVHQCLGQLLARMELQTVHAKLWKRVPTLKLAARIEDLHFFEEGSNYEVTSVPVTW